MDIEDSNKSEDNIEKFKYFEYLLCYTPNLWKNKYSMQEYINYFINKSCLDINYLKKYYTNIVCPEINQLTHKIIEILKNKPFIKSLVFTDNFVDENNLFTMLPEHIEYITLRGTNNTVCIKEHNLNILNLPRELIYLDINNNIKYLLTLNYLPAGLKVLRIGTNINIPIEHLPQGLEILEILEIGNNFHQNIDNLPDSIKMLIFTTEYSIRNIYNSKSFILYINKINKLPKSLEVLILNNILDTVICDIDFSNLINLSYLVLPYYFDDYEFFNSRRILYPPNLKILHIGKMYNKQISILPPSLEVLIVHQDFNIEYNLKYIPCKLKNVKVDIRNEVINNDNCHYETFKKIQEIFPSIKVEFLSR